MSAHPLLRRAAAALMGPTAAPIAIALMVGGSSSALGAQLRIPQMAGGKASIQLVDQAGQRPVLGFKGPEWATAYQSLDLAEAQTVELTPTADIATVAGVPTCYLVAVTAPGGRGGRYCVQVPDSGAVQELAGLVGAFPIDPADLDDVRLIPPVSATVASLRVPPLTGGVASIQLVASADQRPVLGFDGPEWATAYQDLAIDSAKTVALTPTAAIATAGGGATCYLVTVSAPGGRNARLCVQMPDVAAVHELAALVGAAAIDPADILGGKLIPPGGAAGDVLSKASADDYATAWAPAVSDETDPVASPLIETHLGVTGGHPASAIANTPAGNVAATDVQAAVNELDGEKIQYGSVTLVYTWAVAPTGAAFRAPAAGVWATRFPVVGGITLSAVICSVSTAPVTGYLEIDVLASGVSIFSTPLTIDEGEFSSLTAAVPAVLSDTGIDYNEALLLDILAVPAGGGGASLACWMEGPGPW